uniref:Putative secreted protein n=1 Tax=Ixodes ricinus TaxID=34613 RepID=A0A6B0U9X1_IXORI
MVSLSRAAWVLVAPMPPSSGGTCIPKPPSSFRAAIDSSEILSFRSFLSASFTSVRNLVTGSSTMRRVSVWS